jgi:CubicO group peptidase (beta-lactamase class C family)
MLSIGQVRDDLQGRLARLLLKHDVPGASVAVAVGEETASGAAGVVNKRTGVPARPDSVFQIQSITKVWTATLVMQLADEGLVDLDDPVRSHLPGFRTAHAEASACITIRHLLTHTGGFEGDLWKATTDGDDALQRLVEDFIPQAPQHEPPGSRYSYCSAGMAVLGRIVELKRGLPFAAALRAHLAAPLGIEEIAGDADEALGFSTAIGHIAYADRGMQPLPMWASMPASNPAAGNRLSMSARALLAFGRMHLADGAGPDGKRILSEASAEAMRVDGVAIPASPAYSKTVGLGWEVYHGGAVIGHGGGALGISSTLLLVPEHRIAIAVLTNGGDFNGLHRDLIDPWIHRGANVRLTAQKRELEPPRPVPDAERYIGVYGVRNQRVAIAVADDGGLDQTASLTGEFAAMFDRAGLSNGPFAARLHQVSGDLFATAGSDGTASGYLQFLDTEPDGRARFVHTGGRTLPRIAE